MNILGGFNRCGREGMLSASAVKSISDMRRKRLVEVGVECIELHDLMPPRVQPYSAHATTVLRFGFVSAQLWSRRSQRADFQANRVFQVIRLFHGVRLLYSFHRIGEKDSRFL